MSRTLHNATAGFMLLWVHLVCQFLMWMDEGYYDFRWMSDGWNWVIYFIYTTLIFFISVGFYWLVFGKGPRSTWKVGLSVFVGFVLMAGVLLLLYVNSDWTIYQD
ncbi:MAG: hypothetical protein ACPHGZ_08490 [Schleiferiaceae bacterium]